VKKTRRKEEMERGPAAQATVPDPKIDEWGHHRILKLRLSLQLSAAAKMYDSRQDQSKNPPSQSIES
jgi:hypothetical protein